MEALRQTKSFDPINEVRRLLSEIEQHPELLNHFQDGIKKLLREMKESMRKKGKKTYEVDEIESSWDRVSREKTSHQLRKIVRETQDVVEKLMDSNEKDQKKSMVHKMRNILQNMFLGDNREIILRWELFLDLINSEIFQTSGCRKFLSEYKTTVESWRKKYEKTMFIKDREKAFKVMAEETNKDELHTLGKSLEVLLDKITNRLNEWEKEMNMI